MQRMVSITRRAFCVGALLLVTLATGAAPIQSQAAIATAHPLATAAGEEILKAGGNAFDAAVAITAALAVVEPQSSGLGGGGFYLLHRAEDGHEVMLDARETAPAAATPNMFLDAQGNVIRGASTSTALASGIPGTVAGIAKLARDYGKLPLRRSLQPAVKLARQGFPVYERLRSSIEHSAAQLKKSHDASGNFLNRGNAPANGFRVRQPQLADTLEMLARNGERSFYEGEFAHKLVAGMRKLGGIWSEADLANYKVLERQPIKGMYRGAIITSAPPPSAGGIALIEALNILSGYQLDNLDAAARKHLVVEALRRAYRDRTEYLGDPDFVAIPVNLLTDPAYAAGQRTTIRLDKATPSALLADASDGSNESPQTTHFSVLDAAGNRVAATVTVNLGFGSGLMVDGTGFFLNNEMDDFSTKPGATNAFRLVGSNANAIAPGKRMLSSMTPTFVETDKGVLILGTPGGSRIISMVLLGVLHWLDGASAMQVAALPRFHHQYQPDQISFETDALNAQERAALQTRGHRLEQTRSSYGNMQVITLDKSNGRSASASDPRGDGAGWVY